MSSARVFQKMPCGPARPNAVRTPSTNTTSRRSTAPILRSALELGAQILELPAVGGKRLPVVLQEHSPAGSDELPLAASVQQPAIDVEPVTRRVDGLRRL